MVSSWYFLIIFPCWNSYSAHALVFLPQWASLRPVIWTHTHSYLSDKSLISVSLQLLLGDFSYFLFGTYNPVSSFSLTLCWFLYIKQALLSWQTASSRWTLSVSQTEAPTCLSNLCDCPSIFVISGSRKLRMCEDLSVSQRHGKWPYACSGSGMTTNCLPLQLPSALIESSTFRQQLRKSGC